MKAALMTSRPDFNLMKQTDIQSFYHLQMPRWLCPFHKNYFFSYLRGNYPREYEAVTNFDHILSEKPKTSMVESELYLSYSCKRICELTDDDCNDAETFSYKGKEVWNGF